MMASVWWIFLIRFRIGGLRKGVTLDTFSVPTSNGLITSFWREWYSWPNLFLFIRHIHRRLTRWPLIFRTVVMAERTYLVGSSLAKRYRVLTNSFTSGSIFRSWSELFIQPSHASFHHPRCLFPCLNALMNINWFFHSFG